ncbi:MAG: HEAT repeat domain-containing protein [Limisphaerales bacterium]
MRPKFVFALLSLAALVLGAALLLKQHLGNTASPPPVAESVTPAPAVSVTPPPAPAPIAAAPVVTNTLTDEQREAAIDAETDRLQEWSMNDDPASLSNILADLTNPEKEIRDAAIEAAKQFGSTNAIPTLKAVAANTTDLEEQSALLEAADFLSLPAISDSGVQLPRTPEQIQAAMQKQAQRQRQNPQ